MDSFINSHFYPKLKTEVVQKVNIAPYRGTIYKSQDLLYHSEAMHREKKLREEHIEIIYRCYLSTYLRSMPVFKTPNLKFPVTDDIEQEQARIIRMIKRFKEEGYEKIIWKLVSDRDGVVYVDLTFINDDDRDDVDIYIVSMSFNPDIITFSHSYYNFKEECYFNSPEGLFLMSREHQKNGEEALRRMVTEDEEYLEVIQTGTLHFALKELKYHHKNGGLKIELPHHSNCELYFYSRIVRTPYAKCKMVLRLYETLPGRYKDIPKDLHNKPFDSRFLKKSINHDTTPLIDFSAKEWKYVNKYSQERKTFEADGPISNIKDALTNPRYGKNLMIPFGIGNSEGVLAFTDYELDGSDLVLVLSFDAESYTFLFQFKFGGIDKYRLSESMISAGIYVWIHDLKKLPSCHDDVGQVLLKYLPGINDSDRLINMMICTLSVYMIIHDAPERTRMVKETHMNHNSNKDGTSRNKQEYTTRRILKTAYEAKKYVKEKQSSGDRYVEYTLEEWERIGHYRRVSNTDRTVWIEATTCKRHLPLTEKEVHIKL